MPRAVVVEWAGDVDLASVAAERERAERLIGSGVADPLCLDLARVDFLDSSALGLLLYLRQECEDARVELRLQNVPQRVRQLFSVTGLSGLFTIDGERAPQPDVDALPLESLLPAQADPVLDDLALLTARLLDAPIALVSLVDRNGHVMPGASGLRQPYQELRVTPLSHSLCRHVVEGEVELVVPDLQADPMFTDHPARHDLDVAAYVGIPITGSAGNVVGSVCAIDTEPVEWTSAQLKDLRLIARIASAELQAREAVTSERAANESYRSAHGVATQNLLAAGLLLTRALAASSGPVAEDINQTLTHADGALTALAALSALTALAASATVDS